MVGVLHNAPYQHFRGRNAMLAAVAERDFLALGEVFQNTADSRSAAASTAKPPARHRPKR